MNTTIVPTNSTVCGTLLYNQQLSALFTMSVEVCTYRFMTCCLILLKIFTNLQPIRSNPLFIPFFVLLLLGNILLGSSYAYLGVNTYNGVYNSGISAVVNILSTLGVLCVDTFFGLVPNLFYSVYKTSLHKTTDEFTKRYFIANGFVVASFFLTVFVLAFSDHRYSYVEEIVILIELIYTTVFYAAAIRAMTHLKNKKMKRTLVTFFSTFALYAVFQAIRSTAIIVFLKTSADGTPHLTWLAATTTSLSHAVLMVSVVMFLKDLRLSRKKADKTPTGGSHTASTSDKPKDIHTP